MPLVTQRVSDSNDEALAFTPGTLRCPVTIAYYIGNDGAVNDIGMRFQLSVPPGALIVSAKITFTASANLSGDTVRTNITYQDADNPGDFSGESYATFQARARSSTSIAWDFTTNWATGSTYDTVDLTELIQALVDELYWASGEYCVIFVDDDGSDASAYRQAYSYYVDANKAPLLTVEYSIAPRRRRMEDC
jgi:hypothetical protein